MGKMMYFELVFRSKTSVVNDCLNVSHHNVAFANFKQELFCHLQRQ